MHNYGNIMIHVLVLFQEGAEFLQREGFSSDSPEGTPPDQLCDDQGTPKVKRATTMEVTAKVRIAVNGNVIFCSKIA